MVRIGVHGSREVLGADLKKQITNTMKNKLKLFAAFLAVSGIAFADVALSETISVGGFVDMSYSDGEGESTVGIDQVEVDFSIDNGSPVTARINVQYEDGENQTEIEEAYVTYAIDPNSSVMFGRFESNLFFDASEPTGLYQVSTAYSNGDIDLVQSIYDLGDQGIRYNYNGMNNSFTLSLVDNGDSKIADGRNATDDTAGDYSIEATYGMQFTDQFAGFLGARMYEPEANGVEDGNIWNAYVTYEVNQWLFAAEYLHYDAPTFDAVETFDLADGDLYQLMANYSYSDKNSVTVRYSKMDTQLTDSVNDVTVDVEGDKWTIAHNAALADNLAVIAEFSRVDLEAADDADEFAVELLYSF